jgi:rhodanese-related sulfurtransferase
MTTKGTVSMNANQAKQQMDQLLVLDVREPQEWAAGHIDGAVHVPMGDVPARVDTLTGGQAVLAVCRSGHRSGQVAEFLTAHGAKADNLDGGLQGWAQAGLPLVTESGQPGTVA